MPDLLELGEGIVSGSARRVPHIPLGSRFYPRIEMALADLNKTEQTSFLLVEMSS